MVGEGRRRAARGTSLPLCLASDEADCDAAYPPPRVARAKGVSLAINAKLALINLIARVTWCRRSSNFGQIVKLPSPHPQPLSQWERVAEGRVRGPWEIEPHSSAV